MRDAFAHEAILSMDPDADTRALGAAITVALCGHWDHEPPCPLAPHHTNATRVGTQVHLRTLFAVEPAGEAEVRERIGIALGFTGKHEPHAAAGHLTLAQRALGQSRPRRTAGGHSSGIQRAGDRRWR